ncbi:MAG: hypothetical protein VX498_13585 [Myxococcota bacterium]|nr:hypothetical protein [Myxococcota bacterium]
MAHERWEVIEVRLKSGQWRRVGPHRVDSDWSEGEEFPDSGVAWEPFAANKRSVFYRKYVAYLLHGDCDED